MQLGVSPEPREQQAWGPWGAAKPACTRTPVSSGVGSAGFEDLLGVQRRMHMAGGRGEEGAPEFGGQMPVPGRRGTESSALTHQHLGHRVYSQSPSQEDREFQDILRVLLQAPGSRPWRRQPQVPFKGWGQGRNPRSGLETRARSVLS